MIQVKAKTFARQQEWQNICSDVQYFKFSHKWLDGFMVRYNLSNRHHTTVAQHLPDDLIKKQQEFLAFIMYRRIQHDYPLGLIGNMDETPMTFDLPSNTTVDEMGTRTVSIRTTGHEKTNFTVVLTWMDENEMLYWIENVWSRCAGMLSNPQSLLVLDSFSAHIVDSVKCQFGEKNTNIAIISGGLTSRLQPLDVSMNK